MFLLHVLLLTLLVPHITSTDATTYRGYAKEYLKALEEFGDPSGTRAKRSIANSQVHYSEDVDDEKKHFLNFVEFYKKVHYINADNSLPYTAKINRFSLETEDERKVHLGLNLSEAMDTEWMRNTLDKRAALPESMDWRERGAVTKVKHQLNCGCCWSFSAVGAMESNYYLATGDKVELSEQEVLDCAYAGRPVEHFGCRSGWISSGMKYVVKTGRLTFEKDAPYKAVEGPCAYRKKPNALTKARLTMIYSKTDGLHESLMRATTMGVVSVVITVELSLYIYEHGIYEELELTRPANHAVMVTGYGQADGRTFWMVKNSWGDAWGEDGYVRMSRDIKNNCNISKYVVLPLFTCKRGQTCKPSQWYQKPVRDVKNKVMACRDTSSRCKVSLCSLPKSSRSYKWAARSCRKMCKLC